MGEGVYDLSKPEERLRLLLDQPTKHARKVALQFIRTEYGDAEADRLKSELYRIAGQRQEVGHGDENKRQ
jgi:hypothetical protein